MVVSRTVTDAMPAELDVLAGYDDDLAQQTTHVTNRPHDALLYRTSSRLHP